VLLRGLFSNFLTNNTSSNTISDSNNGLKNLSIYETIINFFVITKTLLAIVPIISCLAYG